MIIKEIPIIKQDKRGVVYRCGNVGYCQRKKGTITADHSHPDYEIFHLVKGNIEITIGDEKINVQAPKTIEIPQNAYHKIQALTDIIFIYDRAEETHK